MQWDPASESRDVVARDGLLYRCVRIRVGYFGGSCYWFWSCLQVEELIDPVANCRRGTALNEIVSRRVRFDGGTGQPLAGIVDAPVVARDDGSPVVVFAHCFTCNKDLKAIVRLSRLLARGGVSVLRFDMTGLGDSEGEFSRTDFLSNLADLRKAIEFAGSDLGRVDGLIGHSLGGAAAMAVAGGEDVPGDLSSLVTLAAPSDTSHLAKLLVGMNPSIETEGQGEVSIGGRTWTIRREFVEQLRQYDLPGQISKIVLDTLSFHSPTDSTVAFDHALRIVNLIRGGDRGGRASLVTLPGSDHLLTRFDRDWPFIAEMIAAFVRRHARQ